MKSKRKAEAAPKKLRSKRPRRRRAQISPVLQSSLPCKEEGASVLSVVSISGSFFDDDDVSCGSIRVPESLNLTIGDLTFRRITRSFYKQKQLETERNEAEVSEGSCVESNSGLDFVLSSLKVQKSVDKGQGHEGSENDAVSIISVEQVSDARNSKLSSENKENDDVSVTYGLEFFSDSKFGSVTETRDGEASLEFEFSEISKPNSVAETNFNLFNSKSVVEQQPKAESDGCDSDLVCMEQLQYDEVSECSENSSSEWHSYTFLENSDLESLDCAPSTFFDSGSEFSQKSSGCSSASETYSLFLKFKEQFRRSAVPNTVKANNIEEHYEIQPPLVKFEDDEDEESYQRFRERERRQVYLREYADDYCSRSAYGDLVLCQRLRMVRWIVEQCTAKELKQETMFLGVGLFDQFLSRGFFKSERNLQIVGIACLTLANRIEENQPYNCVRQRNFFVQNNKYSRCEVVGMEWLVQEVLNFQCFLPTIYNFLWFYLRAAKADAEVEKKAKYLAMLALSDWRQLCYWPSTVAASLVILASIDSNQLTAYERVIQVHIRTNDDNLPECAKKLERLLSA